MIKALLFDMDGTITDTERIYNKYWISAHHQCGYTDYTFEDALAQRSLNKADSMKLWKDRYGDGYDWNKVHDLVTKGLLSEISSGVTIKPGVYEIINHCKSKGIPTAIVTATAYEAALSRLDLAGLTGVFDLVISAHFVERGKPYPDVYQYACKKLNLSPEDVIAVEDSPNGCLSAIRAGCKTIMVPDLSEPDSELLEQLFARCDTLADIISYI